MFLPEVAEAAPWTMPPFTAISIAAQKTLAFTVPVRLAQRPIPPTGSFRTGVPQSVTSGSLPARRPYGNGRCEDPVVMPWRNDKNAIGHPQLLGSAETIGASCPEVCAIVPRRPWRPLEGAAQPLNRFKPTSNGSGHPVPQPLPTSVEPRDQPRGSILTAALFSA